MLIPVIASYLWYIDLLSFLSYLNTVYTYLNLLGYPDCCVYSNERMNGHGVREPGVKPSYMNWKSALDDPKTPQSLNLNLVL